MARSPDRRSTLQITEVRAPRADPRAERDSAPPPIERKLRETLAREGQPPLDEHGPLVRTARLHRQISQLQEQLADAQRELSIVNRERADEAERNDELRAQIVELQTSLLDLEAALSSAGERIVAAKDRERELETEVASLREALTNSVSDSNKKKLEAELRDRDFEIARLRGEVVDVKALKSTRSQELSAVKDTVLAADLRAKEAEQERDRVRAELDALRSELERVTTERESIDKDLVLKRDELEHLRGVEATLRGLLSQVDSINRDLVRLVGDAERSIQGDDEPPAG